MDQAAICCFTGHRSIRAEHIKLLPELLDRTIEDLIGVGVTVFRAGGAVGFDTLAALKVLEKREQYGLVRLELILPCRNQTERWDERSRLIYEAILSRADSVIYVQEVYTPGCMAARNRRLVDGSRYCIAFCGAERGGSAYTVNYAKKKQVSVINLYDMVF